MLVVEGREESFTKEDVSKETRAHRCSSSSLTVRLLLTDETVVELLVLLLEIRYTFVWGGKPSKRAVSAEKEDGASSNGKVVWRVKGKAHSAR